MLLSLSPQLKYKALKDGTAALLTDTSLVNGHNNGTQKISLPDSANSPHERKLARRRGTGKHRFLLRSAENYDMHSSASVVRW